MRKKFKSPSFTVAVMIFAMLISKLLGMFRGVLLAASYDISEAATAFSAASRIPLSFFDIIFASAILGCFIPVYNSFNDKNSQAEKNVFTSVFLNFLLLITGVVALLGIVFAEQLINIVAPGLLPETEKLAVLLLRIMFPLIVFAAASYTFVGVLQSNDEYIVPAFISAVSNILIIVYFIFFDERFGIVGLAVAYTLAWFVQLLTLVLPIKKAKFKYKFLLDFKHHGFLQALKMTPSVIMGSWLAPVCLLISMRFATLIDVHGAVPSFEYAVNLFTVITGITTYGVCNYIFPKLSTLANGEREDFASTGRLGLTSALLMTVPIAAIVFSLAPQGVSIVYQRGSFDALAAQNVTVVLKALVPGMIGFTLVEFLSRTFYALKKPIFSVISVLFGIAVNFISVFITVSFFEGKLMHIGLSYSLGMLSAGILMLAFALIRIKGFFRVKHLLNVVRIFISGIASLALMLFLNKLLLIDNFNVSFVGNFFSAVLIAFIGIVVYFIVLLLLKEETLSSLKRTRKKR